MHLIQIVMIIVIAVCFYEYEHLRHNKIKGDEDKFMYIGLLLVAALLSTLFFKELQ